MKTPRFFLIALALVISILNFGCEDGLFSDCRRSDGENVTLDFDLNEVSDFDFALSGEVIVSRGETQSITIEGPEDVVANINTLVNNGFWRIDTRQCFRKYDPVTITMTIRDIENITLSGAGSVTVLDTFNTEISRVIIAGSGDITWRSISEQIEAVISGSGNVELIGTSQDLFGTVAGSGNIRAKDLPVSNAEVVIAGSGNAEVSVAESLDVRIAGSGSVFYYGDPSDISQSITGSGSVIKRD
ncbi:MAG: head GIN domain-containing protein [Bacteroidota bacterium]